MLIFHTFIGGVDNLIRPDGNLSWEGFSLPQNLPRIGFSFHANHHDELLGISQRDDT